MQSCLPQATYLTEQPGVRVGLWDLSVWKPFSESPGAWAKVVIYRREEVWPIVQVTSLQFCWLRKWADEGP